MKEYEPGYFDALRARHPYPGGWRAHNCSIGREEEALKAKRDALRGEPLAPSSLDQGYVMLHSDLKGYGDCVEIGGELFARPNWFNRNLQAVESAFEIFSRSGGVRTLAAIEPGSNFRVFMSVQDFERELLARGIQHRWLLHRSHGDPRLTPAPLRKCHNGRRRKAA